MVRGCAGCGSTPRSCATDLPGMLGDGRMLSLRTKQGAKERRRHVEQPASRLHICVATEEHPMHLHRRRLHARVNSPPVRRETASMQPGRSCGIDAALHAGGLAGLLGAHDVFELLTEGAASKCAGVPLCDLPQPVPCRLSQTSRRLATASRSWRNAACMAACATRGSGQRSVVMAAAAWRPPAPACASRAAVQSWNTSLTTRWCRACHAFARWCRRRTCEPT